MPPTIIEEIREPGSPKTARGSKLKLRLTQELSARREPGQILKIVQVSPHHFRVNWLSPTEGRSETGLMKTWKMTRSRFLRVDEAGGRLVITDQTR